MRNPIVHSVLLQQQAEVDELERRLDLPPDVFGGMGDDPDAVIVIKMMTAIEAVLNDKIGEAVLTAASHPKANFDGAEALLDIVRTAPLKKKIELASQMGLIIGLEDKWLHLISDIRNRYAHHIKNFSLSAWEVASKLPGKPRGLYRFSFWHEPNELISTSMLALHVRVFISFLNRVHAFTGPVRPSLLEALERELPAATPDDFQAP